MFNNCNLCPRNCNVNRYLNKGYCGQNSYLKVARAALHFWEEPCLSGENGSGTVFFSGCSLGCVYCQNQNISNGNIGKEISVSRLTQIYFELESKNAHNINLVTPSHFAPLVKESIELAKKDGLKIPFVYNTGGYDKVSTIKMFDKLIDIYLPDLKYIAEDLSFRYSNAKDYFKYASKALSEMVKQTGKCLFDNNNILKKGVIVRHLVLPGFTEESKKIIKYLYDEYKDDIYISIMNQFTPINLNDFPEINRKVTENEYNKVIDFALSLGIENAYIQEGGTADESFIPEFNLEGI